MTVCVTSVNGEMAPGPESSWSWTGASLILLASESVVGAIEGWQHDPAGATERFAAYLVEAANAFLEVADAPAPGTVRPNVAGCITAGTDDVTRLEGMACAFAAGPGPPNAEVPPDIDPNPRRIVLGCGHYQIGIYERGGQRLVGFIPFSAYAWERQLDDTSTATVSVDGLSGDPDCCGLLANTRPWKHELGFVRDGHRCWSGPIRKMTFRGDGITIDASDLTAWWDKRLIHDDHDFAGSAGPDPGTVTEFVDLGTMFQVYADDAMRPDNTPGLCVTVAPIGILAERNLRASQHEIAGGILRELSRAGIDWTVIDRTVLVGGTVVPTVPLPTLLDHHFAAQPTIVLDGTVQGNRVGVRGAGVGAKGDALWGDSRDGPSIAENGLLEVVATESGLSDVPAVRLASRTRLDTLKDAVASIQDGILSPDVLVPIEELVPGAAVPVRLTQTCIPVSGGYRLSYVKAAGGAGQPETITVGFIPAGSGELNPDGSVPVAGGEDPGGDPGDDF